MYGWKVLWAHLGPVSLLFTLLTVSRETLPSTPNHYSLQNDKNKHHQHPKSGVSQFWGQLHVAFGGCCLGDDTVRVGRGEAEVGQMKCSLHCQNISVAEGQDLTEVCVFTFCCWPGCPATTVVVSHPTAKKQKVCFSHLANPCGC